MKKLRQIFSRLQPFIRSKQIQPHLISERPEITIILKFIIQIKVYKFEPSMYSRDNHKNVILHIPNNDKPIPHPKKITLGENWILATELLQHLHMNQTWDPKQKKLEFIYTRIEVGSMGITRDRERGYKRRYPKIKDTRKIPWRPWWDGHHSHRRRCWERASVPWFPSLDYSVSSPKPAFVFRFS